MNLQIVSWSKTAQTMFLRLYVQVSLEIERQKPAFKIIDTKLKSLKQLQTKQKH